MHMKNLRIWITKSVSKNSLKIGFVPVCLTELLFLKTGIKFIFLVVFLLIITFQLFFLSINVAFNELFHLLYYMPHF